VGCVEKKTLAAIEACAEQTWEMIRCCLQGKGAKDFGAVEENLRDRGQEMARQVLQGVIDALSVREPVIQNERCECGHRYAALEQRRKTVTTLVGCVEVQRWYYYDRHCGKGKALLDAAWDIEDTSFSPEVRRCMAQVAAALPFRPAAEMLASVGGISVNPKDIERIAAQVATAVENIPRHPVPVPADSVLYVCMDGTGVPMVRRELAGRTGKEPGEESKTREAKLSCFFTQTTLDAQGHPVRDESSTTYVGAIESAEEFGRRLWTEAQRRGVETAQKIVAVCDAAPWEWNLIEEYLPGAVQIIDIWHAREHCWTVARALWPDNVARQHQWAQTRCKELDAGQARQVARAIRRLRPRTTMVQALCRREADFFIKNRHRMAYRKFSSKHYFIGSGVLEAGCKTVIGQRLKLAGMHWSVEGANAIITLRSAIMGSDWPSLPKYAMAA
jgi:hypothetical protein